MGQIIEYEQAAPFLASSESGSMLSMGQIMAARFLLYRFSSLVSALFPSLCLYLFVCGHACVRACMGASKLTILSAHAHVEIGQKKARTA